MKKLFLSNFNEHPIFKMRDNTASANKQSIYKPYIFIANGANKTEVTLIEKRNKIYN